MILMTIDKIDDVIMQKEQDSDLSDFIRVSKGGGIVFSGALASAVLVFVLTVLIARHVNEAEFGFFSLCLGIVTILSVLSGLGFQQGLPRYIPYQLGKKEYRKAWNSIVSSFAITSLSSLFFAFLLFFSAGLISRLLHKPGLAATIKIMAFIVPLIALMNLLVSYLRAVMDMRGRAYFQNILRPLIGIILMLPVVFYKFSYTWVLLVYTISFFITLIPLLYYTKRKIFEIIPVTKYMGVIKEIVLFSLPLMGVGILTQTLTSIDTFLLGYYASASSVGLYNGALRITQFILLVATSVGFIYLPVATKLFSQNNVEKFTTIYAMITKWTFLFSLPLFFPVFFAPGIVLHVVLGTNYMAASVPLQILSLGYLIHVLMGLNGITCIAIGRTGAMFVTQLVTLLLNTALGILLIPKYGNVGASIASSISLILNNIMLTILVYRYSGVHPFSRGYFRIIVFSAAIYLLFFLFPLNHYLNHNIFHVVLFMLFVFVISLIGAVVTNNLSEEEVALIGNIEEKISKNTRFTDKFLRPLIRRRSI